MSDERVIYSDGSIEDEILVGLKADDKYENKILTDGAIFHNFTPIRENLLNWYPFKKNKTLLEVGAGMGALTGLFCRSCCRVVALEQSEKRAEIIKQRYKKYSNLEVVCGDLLEVDSLEKFDYIVLTGVLEYVGIGNKKDNIYQEVLDLLATLLKNDGVIFIAIENRFGLKYWCGAAEDHTGVPFDGISGYDHSGYTTRYNADGVKTFSKKELEVLLNGAGFSKQRWYYPLPDYKFPNAIFSDEKLPSITDIGSIKFTYPEESELVADERKLYGDVIDNNVFPFFANSFLIEASREKLEDYYIKYASCKRDYKDQYRLLLTLNSKGNYIKSAVTEAGEEHLENCKRYLEELSQKGIDVIPYKMNEKKLESPAISYPRADEKFRDYLKSGDIEKCIYMLELLKTELRKSSRCVYANSLKRGNIIEQSLALEPETIAMGPVLEYGYIDMTFSNSFYSDKKLVFFDQEWKFPNVPVNYILYRALIYGYNSVDGVIKLKTLQNYLCISDQEMKIYANYEKILLQDMMNAYNCEIFDPKLYHDGLKAIVCAKREYSKLYDETENLKQKSSERIEILENKLKEQEKNIEKRNKESDNKEREWINLEVELRQKIQNKEDHIRLLECERTNLETELRQEIQNREDHIQCLLSTEQQYNQIVHSKMFKVMRLICKTYDIGMFIPRLVVRNICAFSRMMAHVNMQELKIACGYVKNEGIRGAYHHLMKDYHKGDLKTIHVDVKEPYGWEEKALEDYEKITLPICEEPVVSIVIPAYNQFAYTYHCIESILENSRDVSYEVILADDCSNDLTVGIREVIKNLVVARTEKNMLFLRNCNNASKFAKGKYILFLNNDTQVQQNWLRPLIDLIESNDTIGMVGSKLVYSDGTLQEAGGIIWRDGSGWNYGRNMDAMLPEYNYVKEVDYISGASIMIRADLWKRLGGFDELFAPAYCEDSDLAFQVRKAGYKVMYQPLSVVVHFEGKSNGTDLNSGIKKYQVENNLKLQKKWKSEFEKMYDNGQNVFKARERGQEKKTILIIDHYVPQYDKDAGSKTTFQYIKMFLKKGYIVKFIGDNFYQHEPYTTVLQQMGVEVLYGPWYAQHWQEWIMENQKYIDFAYLNRPHITIKYIDFLKEKTNIKCIYYGHDLHFLRLQREYEITREADKKKEAREWQKIELDIMRKANMNYYPSYVEEKEIHKIDPSIPVKAITAYVYETFLTDIAMDFSKREGIMFVGGFGHPPNEDAVLWFAEKIYPLIEKVKKIPFYVVGSNPTDKIQKLNGENIIIKGFVSEEELRELYNKCKLVVVPLRYGAGVKGKVVEALYYGTPMVTTSVGIEGISGAENIIEVADDAEAFANLVLELYDENEALIKRSEMYQTFVKERFGVEAVWNVIKDDFQ